MEDLLDGDDLRPVPVDRLHQTRMQSREPDLDRSAFPDRQHAVIDVPHARPAGVLDHAEPAEP